MSIRLYSAAAAAEFIQSIFYSILSLYSSINKYLFSLFCCKRENSVEVVRAMRASFHYFGSRRRLRLVYAFSARIKYNERKTPSLSLSYIYTDHRRIVQLS